MKLRDIFSSLKHNNPETKRDRVTSMIRTQLRMRSRSNPGDGETIEQSPQRGRPGNRIGADGPTN